jgi:NADH-quinone oxidoreductase subunit J
MMDVIVFAVSAVVVLAGALGVVLNPNPVHAALSLVATLFGIAVMFVSQEADFLAAVQVIVYAGAIVVLFLFVIMLLGVDRTEDVQVEPLVGQRVGALVAGVVFSAGLIAVLLTSAITGARERGAPLDDGEPNLTQLGRLMFTDYLFAFEVTSVLLVIAVVGAVVLARRRHDLGGEAYDDDEPDPLAAEPEGDPA